MVNLLKGKLHIKEKDYYMDYMHKKYKSHFEKFANLNTIEEVNAEIKSINAEIMKLNNKRNKIKGVYTDGVISAIVFVAGGLVTAIVGFFVASLKKDEKISQLKASLADDPTLNEIMTKFQAESPDDLHHYIDLLKGGLDYSQSALSTEEILKLITKYDALMSSIESQATDYAYSIFANRTSVCVANTIFFKKIVGKSYKIYNYHLTKIICMYILK